MYIKRVVLENLRGFRQLDFDFGAQGARNRCLPFPAEPGLIHRRGRERGWWLAGTESLRYSWPPVPGRATQ